MQEGQLGGAVQGEGPRCHRFSHLQEVALWGAVPEACLLGFKLGDGKAQVPGWLLPGPRSHRDDCSTVESSPPSVGGIMHVQASEVTMEQ